MAIGNSGIEIETGEDLWKAEDDGQAITDQLLWEQDVVMLLGTEKAGKSLYAMQWAMSITSGDKFLDLFEIPEALPILYIQTEGKKGEFKERLARMKTAVNVDDTKFFHLFKRFLPLDVTGYRKAVEQAIDKMGIHPKVIFLDSLYTSMQGNLNANEDVRHFFFEISHILDKYKCSLVIIHHERKSSMEEDSTGGMGDRKSYGSVFLRAYVHHILFLKMNADKSRTFKCDTQRSGAVFQGKKTLHLIQPTPLYFTEGALNAPGLAPVAFSLKKGIKTYPELEDVTGLSRSSLERAIRYFKSTGEITVTEYPGARKASEFHWVDAKDMNEMESKSVDKSTD